MNAHRCYKSKDRNTASFPEDGPSRTTDTPSIPLCLLFLRSLTSRLLVLSDEPGPELPELGFSLAIHSAGTISQYITGARYQYLLLPRPFRTRRVPSPTRTTRKCVPWRPRQRTNPPARTYPPNHVSQTVEAQQHARPPARNKQRARIEMGYIYICT